MRADIAPAETTRSATAPLWASTIATFFGIGKLRPGPGTWASAAAAVIWCALSRVIAVNFQSALLGALIVIVIAFGIPAATAIARTSGLKDPQIVVIDEVAGQWITFLLTPVTWKTLVVGFILFRGFDILKPPPVRQLERLPEGTGIVVDDVAAGVYSFVIMQLLLHFGLLSH
jgi:phosphatidylglycerophosphatase A